MIWGHYEKGVLLFLMSQYALFWQADIKDIPGCITLASCNFTDSDFQQRIKQFLPDGQADVVMRYNR